MVTGRCGAGVWFEAIYPHHKRQVMRQSPTGVQLNMEIAEHTNFSLAVAMMGAGGKRAGDDVRRVISPTDPLSLTLTTELFDTGKLTFMCNGAGVCVAVDWWADSDRRDDDHSRVGL